MFLLRICLCWLLVQPVFANQSVNINSADAAQLSSALSGVGEKKAQQIVAWRQQHGPFKSLDDLAKVKGVGPKLVERNKERIVFGPASSARADKLSVKSQTKASGKSSSRELIWPISPN